MNQQQIQQQLDYLRRELTRINHEVIYQEGPVKQLLLVRQARLVAELERMEAMHRSRPVAIPFFALSGAISN